MVCEKRVLDGVGERTWIKKIPPSPPPSPVRRIYLREEPRENAWVHNFVMQKCGLLKFRSYIYGVRLRNKKKG
jgi:hypothetical protein